MRSLVRANPEHAHVRLDGLKGDPMSSRDLELFMKQYEKSSRNQRNMMIENPNLAVRHCVFIGMKKGRKGSGTVLRKLGSMMLKTWEERSDDCIKKPCH